jgi:hypothetical protein
MLPFRWRMVKQLQLLLNKFKRSIQRVAFYTLRATLWTEIMEKGKT